MKQLKYYLPDGKISKLEQFKRLILHREWPVWKFPRIIQIQTIAACNANCIFCPHGKTKNPLPKGRMDWDLYKKIIDECTKYRMWRISPYLMNEPLMDPEIGERIRYISSKKRFPTYTKINTNASLLTEEVARDLIDSGLDILTCSVHGIVKEKYEQTMVGLSLEKVLYNIDRFLELKKKMRKKKPELRVTMVRTKLIEPDVDKIREYWRKRGVRVSIRPMSNRVNPKVARLNINARPLEPFDWCVRMMQQAYVNVRGELLLCCNDWEQTTILGDLRYQSLYEAWNSEKYMDVRRRFLAGKWKGLLCAACRMQRE